MSEPSEAPVRDPAACASRECEDEPLIIGGVAISLRRLKPATQARIRLGVERRLAPAKVEIVDDTLQVKLGELRVATREVDQIVPPAAGRDQ